MVRILIILIALVCIPISATFAQVQVYGTAGAGAFMESGEKGVVGSWMAENIRLFSDSTSSFTIYQRTGFFWADRENEIQGVSMWVIGSKEVGAFTLSIGTGALYQIRESQDVADMAMKFEGMFTLYKSLGIGGGVDYVPIKNASDQIFVYFLVDLLP